MRPLLAASLLALSTAAIGASPVTQTSKLDPAWQARAKAMFKAAIEIPTVAERGQMPKMAAYVAAELKKAGWTDADITIKPHEGRKGDQNGCR